MPEILALLCPVCGAPLKPETNQCVYCGSVVFIKPNTPRLNIENLNRSVIQEHINLFRRRVRFNHFDEEAHYGLGVAYFNLGLFDSSVEELTIAANQMPENPDIRAQLAVALRQIDDATASRRLRQQLSIILTLDPRHLLGLEMMIDLLLDEGDPQGAVAAAKKIQKEDRENGDRCLGRVARYYLMRNDYDEADSILANIGKEAARTSLISFMSLDHPRVLVPHEVIEPPSWSLPLFGGSLLAFWLLIILLPDVSNSSISALLVWLLATAFFTWRCWKRIDRHYDQLSAQEITIPTISAVKNCELNQLRQLAYVIVQYRQGDLTTPEQKLSKQR